MAGLVTAGLETGLGVALGKMGSGRGRMALEGLPLAMSFQGLSGGVAIFLPLRLGVAGTSGAYSESASKSLSSASGSARVFAGWLLELSALTLVISPIWTWPPFFFFFFFFFFLSGCWFSEF